MIKLTNLSKYYQSGTTVTLGLRKINLSLSCNEFVVITGESGSGKTTLLSTISGLLPYEEGELYFSGIPTSHYDASDWEQYRKEHIAFIFQNYNLIDSYTALENVMTSLLIQGMCPAKAKQTAMHYLERVGIAAYASHHASELSSGQKQRLSIARALAKNTKIIVADEPTGNLDVENGKQIMQLLSELATDKLVLVVTHNYEEAAPFATRKIRMYDGEIVEDTVLSSKQPLSEIKADCPTNVFPKNTRQIARIFTKMDIFSCKKRSLLLTTLLFFTAAASFLFLGNFLANLDDTATRTYNNAAFSNSNKTRIAVVRGDKTPIMQEDLSFFSSLAQVKEVEPYGLSNDVNYFCENGTDYTISYLQANSGKEENPLFSENIYLKQFNKFVRTACGLTEADLAYGTLPKQTNDVVLYAKDDSLLGTTFTCFFSDQKNWPINTYFRLELTVCGILKEETTQYYFSEDIGKILNLNLQEEYKSRVYYLANGFWEYGKERLVYTDSVFLDKNTFMAALPPDLFTDYTQIPSTEQSPPPTVLIGMYDDSGYGAYAGVKLDAETTSQPVADTPHASTKNFVLLSNAAFEEISMYFKSEQANLYITDYAYMDDVLTELYEAGYEAVSPFRAGSVSYDSAKVSERLITLGLSLLALMVLFVLEIIILKALLKNSQNDCLILKSIGMEQTVLKRIHYNTLLCYALTAFVLMAAASLLANHFIPKVHNLMIYYRPQYFLLLFVFNMTAALLTAFFHNRYLAKLLLAGREY